MLKLILSGIVEFWGLGAVCYGAYRLIKERGGAHNFRWLFAGLITVIGTVLDGTVLVYYARAGYEQPMFFLHNTLNATMVLTWLYVAYKDGFFKNFE